MQLLTAIVAVAALSGAPSGPPVGQATVEVVAKRFLRGEATLIDGFCRVPFELLTVVPAADGAGREGVYRFDVLVRDSTGLLLHESGWTQTVNGEYLEIAGASTVEHFSFTVPEGRYTLLVSVTDSASGAERSVSHEVRAMAPDTRVSDLLLSSGIRRAADAATAGPGEIQKGALFIGVATRPVLTPHEPELFYYLEFYPGAEASIEVTPTISTAGGQVVTSGAPEAFNIGSGGGVAARSLSLAGLPEGEYVLRMAVALPDGQVTREAGFTMGGFETEAQIAEVAAAPPADDPFAELTEARLDTLYGPLEYLMESDERNLYPNLSVEGKRSYLRQFWDKRDPTPGTPVNEAMVVYYRQFAEANRRFRESGAGDIPGWRTDRGRVYLKYGEAEEVLDRPVSGDAPPYVVWKYTRPRQLKFVFLDQTGLGNYQLIYTNDRFEASRADWETLLGARAVEDVLRF